MKISKRNVLTFIAAGLGSALMPALAQNATAPMPVVASFSILGDIASAIGGDRIALTVLVGATQDAHTFQTKPSEAQKLAGARLILTNGLAFDGFMDRLIKASGTKAPTAIASKGITPLRSKGGHDHGHGHDHAASDPHALQNVAHVKVYAGNIAAAFAAADAGNAAFYQDRLKAYIARLDELDAEIRKQIGAIPADRRRLVTTHDAFAYFANAYGIEFKSLQGVSTDSEPSAGDLASIIRQVKAAKAPAVFLENIVDPRKMERISAETGAKIGGTLFSDALSLPNGPAPTYIEMMRHNARTIVAALTP